MKACLLTPKEHTDGDSACYQQGLIRYDVRFRHQLMFWTVDL